LDAVAFGEALFTKGDAVIAGVAAGAIEFAVAAFGLTGTGLAAFGTAIGAAVVVPAEDFAAEAVAVAAAAGATTSAAAAAAVVEHPAGDFLRWSKLVVLVWQHPQSAVVEG
jgi:hypothetical protein